MGLRHFIPIASLVLSCAMFAGSARADVDTAKSFVEKEHNQIKKLVEANAPAEDVRRAIDGMVDYEQLAMRTMGKPCPPSVPACQNHWEALTPDQRTEVTGLLRQLVEKNYHKNLGKTRDYEVSFRGTKDQGENVSKVKTEAKSKLKPRDPAIQVDYVILGNGSRYRVIDIVTEGSSMTKNYYDQFHRMLTTAGQGYPYLVGKLQSKVATKDKESP